MDEITRLKARYAQAIEDGRRVSVFTETPEWQWYVERVIKPTIEEYTARLVRGDLPTDKEDYILRGMIQGLNLVIETTDSFKATAKEAKRKALEVQVAIDE